MANMPTSARTRFGLVSYASCLSKACTAETTGEIKARSAEARGGQGGGSCLHALQRVLREGGGLHGEPLVDDEGLAVGLGALVEGVRDLVARGAGVRVERLEREATGGGAGEWRGQLCGLGRRGGGAGSSP